MIEIYFNTVRDLYYSALNSTGEERDRRIYDLTFYLSAHREYLPVNSLAHSTQELSYRTIRNLRGSETISFHLQRQLDAIQGVQLFAQISSVIDEATSKNNFKPFYQWINAQQEKYRLSAQSSVEDVLNAVDEVRLSLLAKNFYSSQIELSFSKFLNQTLNLVQPGKDINVLLSELTNDRDHQLRLLAHLCTVNDDYTQYLLKLTQEETKKVASHFYLVPFFNENRDSYMGFLKLCENARVVEISVPITTLNQDDLPPHVEELRLFDCQIDRLSLTLPKLKKFDCSSSLGFVELNAPHLTHARIFGSPDLSAMRLNTPYLESLCVNTASLSTLTLDTPFLSILSITDNTRLNTITLVHPDRLRIVSLEGCTTLRSFTEPGQGLPNCHALTLYNCPAAIPQVHPTAEVYTGTREAIRTVLSFRVNPKVLEENPLQVLLDLGTALQSQPYFPNIIWINPLTGAEAPGIDAGGLRRHFVAALTENLPPILEDKLALETFGRLIGFAAESSLLLGRSLPLEFYYELLSESGSHEIAKGVKAALGDKWEKWKRNPRESDADFTNKVRLFADQVQGKPVTMDNLFPLLQFDGADVATTKEYFRRFFSEFPLLVDERVFQLKHFHQLMLGSLSLEGRPITIHVKGAVEALPSIHACSGEMEIPTYQDYQTFKHKLSWAFRSHDTFETI